MRLAATFIGLFALLLSGCAIVPQGDANRKQLAALKGPETGSINASLLTQAHQAEDQGDYKRATQILHQLVDKNPDNQEFSISLADDLRRSGDNENALKTLDDVLKKSPSNPAALESKGLCLMNTGEFSEAGVIFGKVMKIDPTRWRTLNGIGILFAMKNMMPESLAYYNAALKQSTDNPRVLNNLALTQAMDHQYDASIETFMKARRHAQEGTNEPKSIDLNLALVYAITGKLDLAEQTAAPHLSKAGLYNNMGFYAYLAKNTDLAKSYLNMALTQSTTYYERAWKNLTAISGDNQETDESASIPRQDGDTKKEDGNHHAAKPKTVSVPIEAAPSIPQNASVPINTIPGAADAKPVQAITDGGIATVTTTSDHGPLLGTPLTDIPERKQ
jgi:Flp pilus assembly protein TadD